MKILKLLNKKNLSIILSFFFLFSLKAYPTEPVDIWNIEPKEITTENSNEEKVEEKNILTNSIYEMQSEKKMNLRFKKMKHYSLKK